MTAPTLQERAREIAAEIGEDAPAHEMCHAAARLADVALHCVEVSQSYAPPDDGGEFTTSIVVTIHRRKIGRRKDSSPSRAVGVGVTVSELFEDLARAVAAVLAEGGAA
jgi:hypothetical protein